MTFLAITSLSFLTLAAGVTYLYAMPAESLFIEFPKTPPPPPGQFAQVITFAQVYVGFINIWVLLLKSPIGWVFPLMIGLGAVRIVIDAIPLPKKKVQKRP